VALKVFTEKISSTDSDKKGEVNGWDDMRNKMGLEDMPYLEYLELQKSKGS